MKKLVLSLLAAAVLLPSSARAQFINIRLPLPPLPPLVVVSPGIQVIENLDEEVFFHDGHYWTRRDGRWYRAPNPQAEFVYVEERHVPSHLRGVPPGQYRHYRHDRHEAMRREEMRREEIRREEMRREELRREELRREEMRREEMRREERHDRRERREEMRDHGVRPAPGHGQPLPPPPAEPDKKHKKNDHGRR